MDRGPARSVLRDLRTLYALGTLGGLTDAELLERFLDRRGEDGEDAFAALVHRHGPTVLGVCRRMLLKSHDAEDAFQATFLVLARRAASIGPREHLAKWLYGVAVRTAKEVRRRGARERAIERRLMDVSKIESQPPEDPDDVRLLLDEELSRLPERYRSALVACELEGKSRHEAAQQLRIPEGTLSTHLARGRKLLRERLRRRGVNLGLGPIAAVARPLVEHVVPERMIGPMVRAALGHVSGCGAPETISEAVSSSAERMLKMMLLTRLTLFVAASIAAVGVIAAVALGLITMAVQSSNADPPKAGPDDLPGRVVNESGAAVPDVQIWAMDGAPGPETVATSMTDGQGQFVIPQGVRRLGPPERTTHLSLFARGRDGSIGWLSPVWRNSADEKKVEIELHAVGDVRGRLTDEDAWPIAGVEVAPVLLRPSASASLAEYIRLSPEVTALFRTRTARDGSFVLKGIPRGAGIFAAIAAPAFGSPTVSWDTTQPVTIELDSRLGQIKGRLTPPDARGLSHPFSLGLTRWFDSRRYGTPPNRGPRPGNPAPGAFELVYMFKSAVADKDGAFQFDALPPGRYVVNAYSHRDGIIATRPETKVDVDPGAVARVEIPLRRQPMITGRVVDARTGKGIAGVRLESLWREVGRNMVVGEATTEADGRYKIAARPGTTVIVSTQVPKTHLALESSESPVEEVKADRTWPDLEFFPATALDGLVVDESGRPGAGAEVYLCAADRSRVPGGGPMRTGPDGSFHLDQLDPDHLISLWARAGAATTDGTITVRPREVKGKLRLMVDAKHALRIRGLATGIAGQRLAGAEVTLRWYPPFPGDDRQGPRGSLGSPLEFATTGDNGSFLFGGLWPGLSYDLVVEARGHNKAELPDIAGKAGETRDVGRIVLISTSGYLAGRVVGSDGQPIAGAAVFNRGDGLEPVATSTDPQGRFRLDGLFPRVKYVFVRKGGYRFTGVRADDDSDGLSITLLRTDEPPPPWKPGQGPSFDQQRAFARQALIRLWEKYGRDADSNGAIRCIEDMAGIDPEVARRWSAEKGHRHDDAVRLAEARYLAETDATAALALLNQKPDPASQAIIQELADRFAETDPPKAIRFAEAAARSRGLSQPDRTRAMARAGAVLVKLGRADVGQKLIDGAARDAAQLPAAGLAGNCRSEAARILAPYDLDRALALVEPFKLKFPNWWQDNRVKIAIAIARTDPRRAMELVDTTGAATFDRDMARTAIAYRIGRDRPNAAIQIIEGLPHAPDSIWPAAALGWLAETRAPRDRVRANALIDRALASMIDDPSWRWAWARSGGAMAAAAQIAACARRIGYPDMDSAIMRVMAARPCLRLRTLGDRNDLIGSLVVSAVPLALLDPDAARTVLKRVESLGGIEAVRLPDVRECWLTAWALVDLDKAEAVFEAELAALDEEKELRLWGTGFFQMVELLTTPLERREAVLDQRFGGAPWRPERRP